MDMMKEAGLLKIFISQSDRSVSVLPSIDKAKEPGAYIAQNGEVAINFGSKEKTEFFKQKVFGSSLQGIADIYEKTPHKIYFKKSLSTGKTLEISNPDFKFSFKDSLGSSYSDSSSSSSSGSLSSLICASDNVPGCIVFICICYLFFSVISCIPRFESNRPMSALSMCSLIPYVFSRMSAS